MSEKSDAPLNGKSQPIAGKVIACLITAVALFYIGGWYVAFGSPLYWNQSDIILSYKEGIAFRFNGTFYGVLVTTRFFNSPVVAWICFICSGILVRWAYQFLSEPDDREQAT